MLDARPPGDPRDPDRLDGAGVRGAGELGRPLPMAVAAVYGPFVVAAVATWLFVDCDHCRRAWLQLLGVAPGVVLLAVASLAAFGSMPALPSAAGFAMAGVASLVIVGLVSWLAGSAPGRVVGRFVLVAAALLASWGAWGLYALVRA